MHHSFDWIPPPMEETDKVFGNYFAWQANASHTGSNAVRGKGLFVFTVNLRSIDNHIPQVDRSSSKIHERPLQDPYKF